MTGVTLRLDRHLFHLLEGPAPAVQQAFVAHADPDALILADTSHNSTRLFAPHDLAYLDFSKGPRESGSSDVETPEEALAEALLTDAQPDPCKHIIQAFWETHRSKPQARQRAA